MDRVGADFHALRSTTSAPSSRATPTRCSCRSAPRRISRASDRPGADDRLHLRRRAKDPARPRPRSRRRSRPTCWPRRRNYREKLIEAVSDFDDDIAHKYLDGAGDRRQRADARASARRRSRSSSSASSPAPPSRRRASSACSTAWSTTCPSPIDLSRRWRARTATASEVDAVVDDKGKLAGLAFKLWTDPFVGKLVFFRVYTGHGEEGACRSTIPRTRRSERVSRLRPHARDRPRGDRRRLRGRHLRPGRRQGRHHRRHALRRGLRHPPRAAVLPRAGHLDVDRAELEGRPGEDGHRPPAPGRRGPDAHGQDRHRTPARSSSPAWASSTWRSSATA